MTRPATIFGDLMTRLALVAAAVALIAGCEKKSSASSEGMPAAQDWNAPSPMAPEVQGGGGADMSNPHAGMDMGGMDMGGGDPHAGIDMDNPHAGMDMGDMGDMGGDPRMAMVEPPDPNRPIDESKVLSGTITASAEVAGEVKPGAILFISAKPINPATGEVIGGPLAAERIDITALPVSFKLSERNAMSAGTRLDGDVLIQARIDGDGDAISKQPGDITGEVRARVPADKLALELDTILR